MTLSTERLQCKWLASTTPTADPSPEAHGSRCLLVPSIPSIFYWYKILQCFKKKKKHKGPGPWWGQMWHSTRKAAPRKCHRHPDCRASRPLPSHPTKGRQDRWLLCISTFCPRWRCPVLCKLICGLDRENEAHDISQSPDFLAGSCLQSLPVTGPQLSAWAQ